MNKDNNAYLKLIIDSCSKIKSFVGDMTQASFLEDNKKL